MDFQLRNAQKYLMISTMTKIIFIIKKVIVCVYTGFAEKTPG